MARRTGNRNPQAASRPRAPARGGLSTSWTWLLLLAIIAGFVAFAAEPYWRPLLRTKGVDPEAVSRGEALFGKNCAVCHGPQGRGERPDQPLGGDKPEGGYLAPALNGTAHAWHHAPEMLFRIVKDGSPAADSSMKGWASRLSDAEIEAVLTYLRSLWPEPIRERYRAMFERG